MLLSRNLPNRIDTSVNRLAWLQGFAMGTPATERGRRRVRRALKQLQEVGLIELTHGRTVRVHLLREDGSGRRWKDPGTDPKDDQAGGYVQLPPELFTNGWLVALSGRALLAMLVLASVQRGDVWLWKVPVRVSVGGQGDPGSTAEGDIEEVLPLPDPDAPPERRMATVPVAPVWFSRSRREEEYGFTKNTWRAALQELEEQQLIVRDRDVGDHDEDTGEWVRREAVSVCPQQLIERCPRPPDTLLVFQEEARAREQRQRRAAGSSR
jgi:hypothetical protein